MVNCATQQKNAKDYKCQVQHHSMVDPLSFTIIYAILTVASSISSNVASSGIFEILKPKIFKNKDSQEIKEALQEVIENLKEKGHKKEWQELQQKIEEITDKTMETYKDVQGDLAKMREDIVTAITQNTDETMGNKEATDELKRIILEYDLPKPFLILTREELCKDFEVGLRPPFRVDPIKRPELDRLIERNQNIFITGKPGIGKTLFLYQIAERLNSEKTVWVKSHFSETDIQRLLREDLSRRILLVWDDIQNNAGTFYGAVLKLTDRFGKFKIICAARSTELEKIEEIPVTFWEDFKFFEEKIPLFRIKERKELIKRCSEKSKIQIADEVTEELAKMSDGTPLYIISVFLDEKYKEAKNILMGDVQNLPENVVDLWRRYFQRLKENEKALLRCLIILSKIGVRGIKPVVDKFYIFNGNSFSEFCDALNTLERQLWIVEAEYGYDCHDVQLEAVPFDNKILDRFKKFVLNEDLDVYLSFLLNFGISTFHYAEIARTRSFSQRIFHTQESIEYIERSIKTCRDLGLRADLSGSLNNASGFYSELSTLQQTREERLESIQTAVDYIEEAIGIYRDLGLRADLSMSLNNASNRYSELSTLQQTREERLESIQTAVDYIEEAIGIYRDLGLILDLANSLAVSVFVYDSYLEFDSTVFSRAMANCDQAINIFLKFGLKQKYCPLLPFGIKYHKVMYTITKSPENQAIIRTYQQFLNQC